MKKHHSTIFFSIILFTIIYSQSGYRIVFEKYHAVLPPNPSSLPAHVVGRHCLNQYSETESGLGQ